MVILMKEITISKSTGNFSVNGAFDFGKKTF